VAKIHEIEPENAKHLSVQRGGRAKRATRLPQPQGLHEESNHLVIATLNMLIALRFVWLVREERVGLKFRSMKKRKDGISPETTERVAANDSPQSPDIQSDLIVRSKNRVFADNRDLIGAVSHG
jgi:hypothetical protein